MRVRAGQVLRTRYGQILRSHESPWGGNWPGSPHEQRTDRIGISPVTAKTHVNRAMTKLHARDRAQLVVLAYESGLVIPRNR